MQEYAYSPLNSAEHIRLLELLPCGRDHDAPISCRLRSATLKDAENQYEALSYAWGSERCELICEDGKVTVSSHLPKALTRLRFKFTVRLLWIDAICINQSQSPAALAERVQQVRLMNRIYSNARSVIVYLGEVEDNDDEILINCLSEIASISDQDWASVTAKFGYLFNPRSFLTQTYEIPGRSTTWSSNFQGVWKFVLKVFWNKPEPPRWEEAFRNPKIWAAFSRFLARSWFKRMWVIQEYGLARSVQILLGEHLKSEDFLSRSVTRLLAHWLSTETRILSIEKRDLVSQLDSEAVTRLLQIGHSFRVSNRRLFTFPDLFHRTRNYNCSDDHDRIYGILALVDQQHRDILFIDYTESLVDLAERVSRFLIHEGHGAYVLYNSIGSDAGGPSWVCKLTRTWGDTLTDSVCLDGTGIFSNASGKVKLEPFAFRRQTLAVRGWIIDSVTDMTSALVDSRKNLPDSNTLRLDWQLEVFEWVNRHAQGSSSFSLECWRAVLADIVVIPAGPVGLQRGSNFPGFEQYVRPFEAYCETFKDFKDRGPGNTPFDLSTFQAICNRADPFLRSLSAMTYNKRLGITKKHGILCQLPEQAQIDDFVAIILGCPIPFVLRPQGSHYSLVGCCYLNGLMDGQVVEKGWNVQEIILQ